MSLDAGLLIKLLPGLRCVILRPISEKVHKKDILQHIGDEKNSGDEPAKRFGLHRLSIRSKPAMSWSIDVQLLGLKRGQAHIILNRELSHRSC